MSETQVSPDAGTVRDVTLDIVAILENADAGEPFGSGETLLEEISPFHRQDGFFVTLDNGQKFRVDVSEI